MITVPLSQAKKSLKHTIPLATAYKEVDKLDPLLDPTHRPFLLFFTVAQSGQYHFPLGCSFSPTHPKWNHSILHCNEFSIHQSQRVSHIVKRDVSVKKLNLIVITCNHLAIANLVADAVSRFVWIHRQIQIHPT